MAASRLGHYWNELEPGLMILVGAVMIVFPEPATSALGVGVVLLGVAWWFYEWDR